MGLHLRHDYAVLSPGRHRESYLIKSHTGTKLILFLKYINVSREGQRTILKWLQISSRFLGFASGSQRRLPSQKDETSELLGWGGGSGELAGLPKPKFMLSKTVCVHPIPLSHNA